MDNYFGATLTIPSLDEMAKKKALARLESLTMPHWALGKVMDLALDLCAMTGQNPPPIARRRVVVFAADHGVTAEGVSLYPPEVTAQMVLNFLAGGAGVNVISAVTGAEVTVVDMGVASEIEAQESETFLKRKIASGTANMAHGPAMTPEQAIASIETGIAIARSLCKNTDVFAAGEMGIGNTTAATAIIAAISGEDLSLLTGRGTGLPKTQVAHKIEVIRTALERNHPDPANGLDLLAKVGGFEIGAIAGLALGAAALRKPVVIDGLISTAGALVASRINPAVTDYLIAAHASVEPGHQAMLATLGKSAYLDLNLRLGEGSGAALFMPLLDAARALLTQMATFESASVSESSAVVGSS